MASQDEALAAQPPRQKQPPVAPPGPCAMVVFGGGGDLTKRLIAPALYNMARTGLMPENFVMIGIGRTRLEDEAWRAGLYDMLCSFVRRAGEGESAQIDQALWRRLSERMFYLPGDLNDAAFYQELGSVLGQAAKEHGTGGNVAFYLAVADQFFAPIVQHLGESGLATDRKPDGTSLDYWRRVVIEKPFGHSLESACALNAHVLRYLREEQIFRIDHYLGKETVQNIMSFRFGNGLFEPIWNRDRIDHVQITVAETVGVERRGSFYEQTGALRDMVPNHVFQLLAMVAMEPPVSFEATAIGDKKAEVFRAMPPVRPENAVRGQYGAGPDAKPYRDEPDVAPDSGIETYVALRLSIDNWRWAGVPFYIRTGKHLPKRTTEIAICFKQAPYGMFEQTAMGELPPNWLVLQIQPNEGISLQFQVKQPGPGVQLSSAQLEFKYKDWFPSEPNVGYETLLYDVMIGDHTLFQRADMVEATWRVVQPILDHWAAERPTDFPNYASGGDGPAAANELIRRRHFREWSERRWRPITADGATRKP